MLPAVRLHIPLDNRPNDAGVRRLRSADTRTLVVGRTQRTVLPTEHLLRQHLGSGTVCRLI